MLEKSAGAVSCAHCHQLVGEPGVCPYCRRMVCDTCLAQESEGCPEEHPRELRLGLGNRLQQVDETGQLGIVGWLVNGQWFRVRAMRLAPLSQLTRFSFGKHHGLPTEYLNWNVYSCGPHGVSDRQVIWVARIAPEVLDPNPLDGEQEFELGLMVAGLASKGGLEPASFVRLPEAKALLGVSGTPRAVHLTPDNRWCLLALDDRVLVVDLERRRLLGRLDTGRQVVHSLACSPGLDLVALGMFGEVALYRLGDQRQIGLWTDKRTSVGQGNVTAVAFGGRRMALTTENGEICVARVRPDRPPSRWETLHHQQTDCQGVLWGSELSFSLDGRLLAMRHRRKEIAVLDLQTERTQILKRHTDRVLLVRFILEGRQLVTADADNRVVFWPRAGDRIVDGT